MALEIFKIGMKNLLLHKLRSLLTLLGVILGVGSVIAMLAVGEGSKKEALERRIQGLLREREKMEGNLEETHDRVADLEKQNQRQKAQVFIYSFQMD